MSYNHHNEYYKNIINNTIMYNNIIIISTK